MKTQSYVTVHVVFTKTYKGVKFIYEYQFVSHRNKMRFRGFEVGRPRDDVAIIFMYPGHSNNRLHDKWLPKSLKPSDFPPDVRNLRKRKDVVIPDEVCQAVKRKIGLEVDTTFAKT